MASSLLRFRLALGLFIIGLALSGITAFPLLHELRILDRFIGSNGSFKDFTPDDLALWITTVREGLEDTHSRYPWLAYGTDWLAFGHLVIAMFFIQPWVNPSPNRWVLVTGLIACMAVVPLAFIAGAVRQVPFYWRIIDCSFGVFGALPLLYCLRLLPKIEQENNRNDA